MHRLKMLWIALTSSLWFVPLTMVGLASLLAMGLTLADVMIGTSWVSQRSLYFGIGASGARGMLSAIAGSMMTVASLTFSLTISTLATASAQYTSRLVRNFMRDTVNQFVLGYFVSLFAYCLIVLRTIRGGDEGQFVPSLAVLGGLVMALLSIGVLIYFIHHIAESIQASTILRNVTKETLRAIDRLFPAGAGEALDPELALASAPVQAQPPSRAIKAGEFGYLQSVDTARLISLASERQTVMLMTVAIGDFVTPATELSALRTAEPIDQATEDDLIGAFTIGTARTIDQDAAFGIRQIVDIALKALSPGINDTTTGVMCVEHLGVLLERLAARSIPSEFRGEDGEVRLIAGGRSFATLAGLCLDQIRQSSPANPAVQLALLRAISSAGRETEDLNRRQFLGRHVTLIDQAAEKMIPIAADFQPIRLASAAALAELAEPPKPKSANSTP